ncbi:MAG: hypothetical protein GX100_01500 [candidate division WS1 bacterium]|nr:hypothetical protein [candidate division WS1 bacterium]
MMSSIFPFLVVMLALVIPGIAPATALEIRMPVPPGEHPRLLFTKTEVPAVRARAATEPGQQIVASLKSVRDRWAKQLAELDDERLAALRKDSKASTLGALTTDCRSVALLYVVTGDAQDAKVAAEMFRIWLSAFPGDEEIQPVESWGDPNAALAYDWIYDVLTPEERQRGRKILASLVGEPTLAQFGKVWWAGGPTSTNRVISGANWLAIFANSLILTNLAIEGEEGYNPVLLEKCVNRFHLWLSESISPEGTLYEGMSYASGYGTHFAPQGINAMRLRGVDMTQPSNVSQVPFWLAYETLPWGFESFDHNQTGGQYSPGVFTTFLAKEHPEYGRWMWRNMLGTGHPDPVIGLVNGLPEASDQAPAALPLAHWFSARGLVFCRSGWGERDAHFMLVTNPIGAGHTHADQGSFCLASNGAYFIADSGVVRFDSTEHNLVHIDGKAQAQVQGGLDAFIRTADASEYADIIDTDLKLSYERILRSDGEAWWWEEYNPVERADRRALFVRGVTGPLLVIADDFRKDTNEHSYDWLAHMPVNNPVTTSGRRFTVAERYGGKYVHTLEKGCEATLVAHDVPAGTYHGWLLVRSEKTTAAWASNDLAVNGKACPYNTAYFGRGNHREGWSWLGLLPGKEAEIEVPAGDLTVTLRSNSGGAIALAVFTRNLDWTPGGEIPEEGEEFIVMGMESLVQGDKPWPISEAPKGVLEAAFLGLNPPAIQVEPPQAPSPRTCLHAVKQGVDMRFLVVMAPHDAGDGRALEVPASGRGQVAVAVSEQGMDIVGGVVDGGSTTGELETDGQTAVVSRLADGRLRGYALVSGRRLSSKGQALCVVTGEPAHVINDGQTLTVRGPGGTRVRCLTLGAVTLVCNGKSSPLLPAGPAATVTIPTLPETWTVKVSPDGRTTEVTGEGPLPLKFRAPEETNVMVNGISRYFVADQEGYMYPCLEQGSVTIGYRNRPDGAALKALQTDPSQGEVVDLGVIETSWRGTTALQSPTGHTTLRLPLPGPAKYRLTLGYAVPAVGPVQVKVNGKDLASITPTSPNHPERHAYADLVLRADTATLELAGPPGLALYFVRMAPEPRPLPASEWRVMGPYAGNFEQGRAAAEDLKEDLFKVWPPETEQKLDAVYTGPDGKERRWVPGDSQAGITVEGKVQPAFQWTFATTAPQAGVNMVNPLGVRKGHICYSVTFITSPEDRDAELSLGVDWWARAFLNGEEVLSQRPKRFSEADGAQFNGDTLISAPLRLKQGVNTLLVKSLGGSGSHSFVAYITDPGDLQIAPKP